MQSNDGWVRGYFIRNIEVGVTTGRGRTMAFVRCYSRNS